MEDRAFLVAFGLTSLPKTLQNSQDTAATARVHHAPKCEDHRAFHALSLSGTVFLGFWEALLLGIVVAKLVDQYEIVGKLVEYFVDSEELLVEPETT